MNHTHKTKKIVCITGASSGIGKACAFAFAKLGYSLILCARREEKLTTLATDLAQEFAIKTLPIALDVRQREDVYTAVESLPDDWKQIDILVNNAGLSRGLAPLHKGLDDDWDEMIDTNLKGLLWVTKAILPLMIERNRGIIINIGSIAGRQVYPNGNVYCASKHAVRAISEALQFDVNGTNVRVTNIDPGMVETEFSLVRFHGDQQRATSVYDGFTPLSGEDVAEVVVFCAERPAHVSIHDLLLMPTAQASTQVVARTKP